MEDTYDPNPVSERERLGKQIDLYRVTDLDLIKRARTTIGADPELILDLGCADGALTADRFASRGQRELVGSVYLDHRSRSSAHLGEAEAARLGQAISFVREQMLQPEACFGWCVFGAIARVP
jgi:hypothetical protein